MVLLHPRSWVLLNKNGRENKVRPHHSATRPEQHLTRSTHVSTYRLGPLRPVISSEHFGIIVWQDGRVAQLHRMALDWPIPSEQARSSCAQQYNRMSEPGTYHRTRKIQFNPITVRLKTLGGIIEAGEDIRGQETSGKISGAVDESMVLMLRARLLPQMCHSHLEIH